MANGPSAETCTTAPLLVQAKWFIRAGASANPLAMRWALLVSSSLSPMPKEKSPEITVTSFVELRIYLIQYIISTNTEMAFKIGEFHEFWQ